MLQQQRTTGLSSNHKDLVSRSGRVSILKFWHMGFKRKKELKPGLCTSHYSSGNWHMVYTTEQLMRLVIHYEEVNVTGKENQSAGKVALTRVFSVYFSDFLERSAFLSFLKYRYKENKGIDHKSVFRTFYQSNGIIHALRGGSQLFSREIQDLGLVSSHLEIKDTASLVGLKQSRKMRFSVVIFQVSLGFTDENRTKTE